MTPHPRRKYHHPETDEESIADSMIETTDFSSGSESE
jgi:hypothetical protein